ncbi:MAG: hypothetical protein ACD_2C00109G0004 [uncultured bacterium (gcode 4)]|uniref:Co-chaperone DjlA N-terminal domain-containing protein n=1 Tax=uncultured bacterium (gcode 4) TaxID=1234023 RepID=K2H1M3_9BACT|nr:MAG: hypothetical protein ACD_2C00109G0004 [uncultured bacterium (gcode 4)]
MEQETEIVKRKALAIYQILLGFIIVDWNLNPDEEEKIIEYIMGNFSILDKDTISLEDQIKHLAADEENFMNNAVALKMTSEKEELLSILLYVSEIMFADKVFSDQEFSLYTKLMNVWWVRADDLKHENIISN